jgi:single-strand DNA-binding protein
MNKVFLKGRLTADPEIRKTANDISVCNFSIAVNRRFDREKTDFINCEAWRQTAEFISKYFNKGKEIVVCGELHIDKWEKDGEIKYLTKVSVDEVEFCGSKGDVESVKPTEKVNAFDAIDDTDDLPFD